MADRPILMSAPMVRATLADLKTQTRRLFKPRGFEFYTHPVSGDRYNSYRPYRNGTWDESRITGSGPIKSFGWGEYLYAYLPYAPGDRLWVREAWRTESSAYDDLAPSAMGGEETILYDADADWSLNKSTGRARASMHMPRWASRITLVVSGVKVERLQDISRDDAIAEGLIRIEAPSLAVEMGCDWGFEGDTRHGSPVSAYAALWDHINGAGAWSANPWVVALTFQAHRQNIDSLEAFHG